MNWKLAGEISGAIIAGLFLVPFTMVTIRTWLDGSAPTWNPNDIVIAEAQSAKEGWIHRILVAFDIFCNVALWRGQEDETISTHSYRAFLEGKLWGKIMNHWLSWFQPNHGAKAASGDLQRAQVRVAILKRILGVD
jgi:hypothetical protein